MSGRGALRRAALTEASINKFLFSALLALALVAIQTAVIRWSGSEAAVRVTLPATIALVPVALWPHRQRLGVWVIFVGVATNLSVIVANGGLMPIERRTVIEAIGVERAAAYPTGAWIEGSKDIVVADGGGRAAVLGDSIIIRGGGGGIAASPGDIIVWAGLVVLGAEASIAFQRRSRHPSEHGKPDRIEAARRASGGASTQA